MPSQAKEVQWSQQHRMLHEWLSANGPVKLFFRSPEAEVHVPCVAAVLDEDFLACSPTPLHDATLPHLELRPPPRFGEKKGARNEGNVLPPFDAQSIANRIGTATPTIVPGAWSSITG